MGAKLTFSDAELRFLSSHDFWIYRQQVMQKMTDWLGTMGESWKMLYPDAGLICHVIGG